MITPSTGFQTIRDQGLKFDVVNSLVLFFQHNGSILSPIPSDVSFYVPGDIGPLFRHSVGGDRVWLANRKLDVEYRVASHALGSQGRYLVNIDYEAGSGPLSSADEGTYIAVGWDVTDMLAEGSPSIPSMALEGEVLNQFDAGQISFRLNDPDGELYDAINQAGPLYMAGIKDTASGDPTEPDAWVSYVDVSGTPFVVDTLFPGELVVLNGNAKGKRYQVYDNTTSRIYVKGQLYDDGMRDTDDFAIARGRRVFFRLQGQISGTTDVFTLMGGLVPPQKIQVDNGEKAIQFTGYGLMKDLEAYPAYEAAVEGGRLSSLVGVIPGHYTPPTDRAPTLGPRSVRYGFNEPRATGINVAKLSADTRPGTWRLQYRRPDQWRWALGGYHNRAAEEDNTLTADPTEVGGSLSAAFQPDSYAWEDTEDLVLVSARGKMKINWQSHLGRRWSRGGLAERRQQRFESNIIAVHPSDAISIGHPTLQFDNGPPAEILPFFDQVWYNDGGYNDKTLEAETQGGTAFDIAEDTTDSLWLGSHKKFSGAYFVLDSSTSWVATGNMVVKYHDQDGTLQTLTVTDGTADFTQDGVVRWETPGDWTAQAEVGAASIPKYYWIKIERSVNNSFAAKAFQIMRYMEASGVKGDKLGFHVEADRLVAEDVEDEVIIKAGEVLATWPSMERLADTVTGLLDGAFYDSTKRDLTDFNITSTRKFIGMWGRIPSIGSRLVPTAMERDTTNSQLLMGLQNELWRIPDEGVPILIYKFPANHEIVKLVHNTTGDHSGRTFGVTMHTSRDSRDPADNRLGRDDWWFTTSTEGDAIDNLVLGTAYAGGDYSVDTRFIHRKGEKGAQHIEAGRRNATHQGENIVFPHGGDIIFGDDNATAFQADMNLAGLFAVGNDDDDDLPRILPHGYYSLRAETTASTDMECSYSFGVLRAYTGLPNSRGIVFQEFDNTYPGWYSLIRAYMDPLTTWIANRIAVFKGTDIFAQCMCPGSMDYGESIFAAHTHWIDGNHGTDRESDCLIDQIWLDNATGQAGFSNGPRPQAIWLYDDPGGGLVYTDETDSGTKTIPEHIGDAIFVGLETKWADPYWEMDSTLASEAVVTPYYWDGAAWIALSVMADSTINFTQTYWRLHRFDYPRDPDEADLWTKGDPIGKGSLFWVKFEITTAPSIAGTGDYFDLRVTRSNVWDSEDAGADRPFTVVCMAYNTTEERLHVTMLDKSDLQYRQCALDIDLSGEYPKRTTVPTLKKTQAGFVTSHAILGLVQLGSVIYGVETDMRFRETPGKLLQITSTNGDVTVTEAVNMIQPREFSSAVPLVADSANDRLYGITAPNDYMLWQYGDTFDVRVPVFNPPAESHIRRVLRWAAELLGAMLFMRPEGELVLKARDNDDAVTTIDQEAITAVHSLKEWHGGYDAVAVRWSDHLGNSGEEVWGQTGFGRRILTINNPYVQDFHLANVLAENVWRHVSVLPRQLELSLHMGWYVQMADPLKFRMSEKLSGLKSDFFEWTVVGISPDPAGTAETRLVLVGKS